jgi:DNA polymerase-3 subunit gamma/tau
VSLLAASSEGDRWCELVAALNAKQAISALVRELAMQSQCLQAPPEESTVGEAAVWKLRVERETLRTPAQVEKLQAAMSAHHGHPVQLQVVAGVAQDSPALRAQALRERRQQEAEQIIMSDPLVQSLIQQFPGARIVPGSIRPQ